ncbi:MAG: rubredoxin [Clostridia bacterium]
MKKYVCNICGFVYDEAAGIPSAGIAPGTKWEDLPPDWVCPLCGAAKSNFREQAAEKVADKPEAIAQDDAGEMRELSVGEMSLLCSNLARGCEKQYLKEESALFTQLADYFKARTPEVNGAGTDKLWALVQNDLSEGFAKANAQAGAGPDRGALRALVWSEKVSHILSSLLSRYKSEGSAFIERTHVYVCETCGFVYVGDVPPALCPVCKVPSWKIAQIERR